MPYIALALVYTRARAIYGMLLKTLSFHVPASKVSWSVLYASLLRKQWQHQPVSTPETLKACH